MSNHKAWILLATLALPSLSAATGCRKGDALRDNPATVTVRSDNDLYGRARQDQGYTNGLVVSYVSPNLADYTDDPCLPAPARWLNGYLDWLQPGGFEQQNMVISFSHGIYTPTDGTRSDLIVDDRPYAGVALLSLGYNARTGERLRTTHLRLGMTGPSSGGEAGQDSIHHFFGRDRDKGWDHELRDEPLLQLLHERLWRRRGEPKANGWSWDMSTHAGGSLGNVATYLNGGAEIRFGKHLPDDFGSDPLRPAGENAAPTLSGTDRSGWAWHFFAGLDARWVARDITLDGNTWKDSHSVDKEPIVADLSFGVAVTKGRWKIAGAHYRRTREFDGQVERPVFGSVSISRSF